MTPITPPTSDDDLPDERELAALYARLPKVEPDASLDAAVLAEATRALPVRRRPRWPVAFASAAVLVLAAGVAWQVRELPPEQPTYASAPPSAAAPAPAAAPVVLAKPGSGLAPATDAVARSIADESAPTPSANVGADSSAMPAKRAQEHRIAAVPAAAPAPAPPPAPAPEQRRYATPAAAPSGMLLQKLAPSALGPDDRVGEIRRLLDRGDRAQALRELKALRQRYPHYDLPQDLRDLNP